jgi:subtilase family serine protease
MAQNKVVSGDEAQIVSNSYGGSSDSTDTTSDGYWEQAAAQGIGVYFSSGDSGDQTAGGTDRPRAASTAGRTRPT